MIENTFSQMLQFQVKLDKISEFEKMVEIIENE